MYSLSTLVLLCCLAQQALFMRMDKAAHQPSQDGPMGDDELDFSTDDLLHNDHRLMRWAKRRAGPNPMLYIPDDMEPADYLDGLRYWRAAQKRFKPKMPIYLGLIGRR